MNAKARELDKVVDIVVECCTADFDGVKTVSREDVLGKGRAENVVMTRAILASMVQFMGYSVTTTAMLLGRTQSAVRHLLSLADDYNRSSRAFRIAMAEATLKCKEIKEQ